MQRGTKGVVIGVCAVLIGGAAYGGYHVYTNISGDPMAHSASVPKVPSGPLTSTEVSSASPSGAPAAAVLVQPASSAAAVAIVRRVTGSRRMSPC